MRRRPRAANVYILGVLWVKCACASRNVLHKLHFWWTADSSHVNQTQDHPLPFSFRQSRQSLVYRHFSFNSLFSVHEMCNPKVRCNCTLYKWMFLRSYTFTYMRPDQVVRQRQACHFSTLTIRGPRLVLALTLIKLEWVPQSGHHRCAE